MRTTHSKREGLTFNFILASLATFIGVMGLLLATTVDHAPTTIPFPHLRPIDLSLKLLTLGIGYFGLLSGYSSYIFSREFNRPVPSLWLFILVSVLGSICLLISGESFSLAVGLSMMAGFNSMIFCLTLRVTEAPMGRVTRYLARALVILFPLLGLVGLLRGGLSPAGLLVPNYWIGETLELEFKSFPYGSALMVGLCFHMFVVMCLVGLNLQRDT